MADISPMEEVLLDGGMTVAGKVTVRVLVVCLFIVVNWPEST